MVDSRTAPLDGSVITFAHRGASAHAPENTREAFELALRLGARGLESDVWLTADGVPVLDHDGKSGPRLRRRPIARVNHSELPGSMMALTELLDLVEPGTPISLDVKDPAAFEAILATARALPHEAERDLWLCSPDLDTLVSWRTHTTAQLVLSTRLDRTKLKPEQLAARLRELDIDALNLRHHEWNGGLVALIHRFERYALAWGTEFEREIAKMVAVGVDGVYSDHVDRMTAVVGDDH